MALTSIIGNAGLITKVYVPKYIYPLTRIMSSMVNLLISLIPLFAVALISGLVPTKAYLLLPIPLLLLALFCLGLGMLLAAAMVFFRDIQFLWGVLTTIWMYLTPIFYPVNALPEGVQAVVKMNPLYLYVTFVRSCIIDGISPEPVMYAQCAVIALVTLVLTALSFTVFRITVLGVVFAAATVILVALLCWMAWIRRQYAFGKGGMMEKVHQTILSSLDFDGHGSLLEVGCGSGALAVRAALTWPEAKITGLDYWGAMYNYSKALCEKNAASEGVGKQCGFVHGDANKLDFPDGSFDAVISNYVYHNIMGADKHALLLESLRVLKKGGVFVLHDNMKPQMYGDMNAFVEKLKSMGFAEVRYVETAEAIFGSKQRAAMMMLGDSAMIVGRK